MTTSGDHGIGNGTGQAMVRRDITFLELLGVLLRNRWLILGCAFLTAGVLVVYTLVQPRSWTAQASFLPQSPEKNIANLAGIAAQLGIAMPTGSMGESPVFYADLLRSREMLGAVVDTEYGFEHRGRPVRGRLPGILEVDGRSPEIRREKAITGLAGMLGVRPSRETGVIRVAVTSEYPGLAPLLIGRMLDLLNEFNLQTRQTQAAEERRFVEERLREAREELAAAEAALETFLQRNRQFQDPSLGFQRDRLQRRVAERQQVVTSLVQNFDHARIEEVRNTPVITVLDRPATPVLPDSRRVPLKAALGLMLGAGAGVLLAFARDLGRRHRDEPDMRELAALREEAVAELARPLRSLRSAVSRGG